jgi:hypothetical protein
MSDAFPKPEPGKFSPRNFLRARRPERFSDSVASERPLLDRTTLEYHLDTVTNRSQEALFEEFARQLAQRELCPNLQSHTGPTGGGDSKVDSETYPVADAISAGWFVGSGGASGSERWAFAISAKKQWTPKVRSDIASLVATGRGYVKAFFISNQYIRDKRRAAEEDALSERYGIEVHIFDRSWILDRVFGGGHEKLAISALGISVPFLSEIRKGPLDTQRERDLEEVEERIKDALQTIPSLALVDDCLEAALLARNLERPRTEIDGRFVRAQRVAVEYGTRHQQVKAFYQQGWTAFWWHEDLTEFERLYAEVERLTIGTENVADAELLSNLWTLLTTAVRDGDLSADGANLKDRTNGLWRTLEQLTGHEDRPSVALQARALLALVELTRAVGGSPDNAFRELDAVVTDAEGLIGFPLVRISEFMTELSEFFVGNKAFERLFGHLVEVTAKRQGEVTGARMLLKLGAEQLDADHPYEAIVTLGQAFSRLYKHESRREMVQALALCASAYERVGLLWAARGTLLNAASLASNEWWAYSEISLAQHGCYNRLKWVELQLGRVPHVLAWHELDRATRGLLKAEGYSDERLSKGERDFDAILGMLLLRSDVWQLKQLEYLHDSLHGLDLPIAALSLLFGLGHTDENGATVSQQEQRDAMARLAAQPAAKELPPAPLLLSEQTLTFGSVVLGCTIELTTNNRSPCIELSESILSAVESLLATSVLEGVTPRTRILRIRMKPSDIVAFPFTSDWRDVEGLPVVDVRCAAFAISGLSNDQQQSIKKAVADLVTYILASAFFIGGEATLKRLFHDEHGLTRALHFTGSFGAIANTLGPSPRVVIQDWIPDTQTRFELRRSIEWDAEERARAREAAKVRVRPSELPVGKGPVPDELFDVSRVKHSEIGFESLIRERLWEKARWRAIGWAVVEGMPPWMVLGFENGEAAAEILTQLVRDIGNQDPENRLRITIVKNISKQEPTHYRVIIGSNVDAKDFKKFGAVMFRVHTMTPHSSQNLDQFVAAYEKAGSYLVGVGVIDRRDPQPPQPMRHGYIFKKTLQVREAWTIGIHEMDSAGVLPDDDIPIPAGHEQDAPIVELLQWKVERLHHSEWPSLKKKTVPQRRQRKANGSPKRLKKGQRRRRS